MPADTAGNGATKIPVTMPAKTEVLGAEDTATSSVPPPIAIEAPIDPAAYICGPGDQFELTFWGQQNFRLRFAADLEGRTFLSKVGYVAVAGQTLATVRAQILKKVRSKYPGLQFELTLVGPRTFVVHVAGNVKIPGSLTAQAMQRVSSVISHAGGSTGSRRRITIHRKGGADVTADLVLYELTGDTRYDPYVLDGDMIQVPFPEVVVSIDGGVRNPGKYELVSTKDLNELLHLAGGLASTAARSLPIRVVRSNAKQQAIALELPFTGGATPNAPLHDQDTVLVHTAKDLQRTVLLIGATAAADAVDAATMSARLPFIEGDTVLSLIDRAGGLKVPGDLSRSYIARPGKDGAIQMIPIDLDALLVRRDFSADRPIQMGDTIVVPAMRHSILVEGAVMRAGLYPYNPSFGIPAYIAIAGGRTHNARDMDEVQLVRPDGKTRSYRSGMKLNPGDAILVPERNFTRGEVVQITLAAAGVALSAIALGYAVAHGQ
ncbi:MAG TPA: SLBB domain-containing protein [Kofleriaceae bacterium]|nr:SLBB domain-containing protein [Kofleriaceae bacterium]